MRISEWSSNVCSSDLAKALNGRNAVNDDQRRGIDIVRRALQAPLRQIAENAGHDGGVVAGRLIDGNDENLGFNAQTEQYENLFQSGVIDPTKVVRSEEHTSELQSLMRISYAVFCLKKKTQKNTKPQRTNVTLEDSAHERNSSHT